MAKVPRNLNLVVKVKKGDISQHEHEFWSSTVPTHADGRLDLVRMIGKFFVPLNFDLVSRFVATVFFLGERRPGADQVVLPISPRQLRDPRRMPTPPADSELWRCSPQDGRLHPSVPASISHIFIFFSVSVPPFVILRRSSLNVRI